MTQPDVAANDRSTRVVAVVQARMSSRRLPGKVLMDLAGQSVLGLVVGRLQRASTLDRVVVATSTDPSDDALAEWCAEQNVPVHRGSLNDVLDRFVGAARAVGATHVVRVTGDCPLIDPDIVDLVVRRTLEGGYAYCGLAGEFPDGLDCEAMTLAALERAAEEASFPSEREHVTPYLQRGDVALDRGEVRPFVGLDHHRWTLDRPEDLELLEELYAGVAKDPLDVRTADVLALLDRQPGLSALNAGIVRNEGYLRSLEQDDAP